MTAWDAIVARMAAREMESEYALAKLLAQAGGMPFESVRRTVNRWKNGSRPNAEYRQLLVAVLGGDADDYAPATERDEEELAQELASIRSRLTAAELRLAEIREKRDADS